MKPHLLWLLFGFTASIPVMMPAIANPASTQCTTWAAYSSKLPAEGGRGNQWKAFGSLPAKFQHGCVLLQDANSVDTAYVFKRGMSIDRYAKAPSFSGDSVPSFSFDQEAALDRLVKKGNALKVTWLTPTNVSLPYLRSIPRDRAFLRKDGMTCFNTVCMMSGAVPHRELTKILSQQ